MSATARQHRQRFGDWGATAEVGSLSALRLMAAIYRALGRRFATLLVHPIAAYFFLTQPTVRAASLDYLRTLRARSAFPTEPGWRDVFRHVHTFALSVFDRMIAWGGGFDHYEIHHSGSEHLFRLARDKRGAILLGAHLGSYDMPRMLAGRHGITLNVLMFTEHASRINHFFETLDPSSRTRVLRIDPQRIDTAFAVKACIDRGELVAILADRVPPGAASDVVSETFFARPSRFSLGPFLLACTLGCPILTSTCVRTGPTSYRTAVELLSEGERATRRERHQRARHYLRLYIAWLERGCCASPLQWFNFFPYWTDAQSTREPLPQRRRK